MLVERAIIDTKQEIIRLTDDIFSVHGYLMRQLQGIVSRDDFNAQFGINEEELEEDVI